MMMNRSARGKGFEHRPVVVSRTPFITQPFAFSYYSTVQCALEERAAFLLLATATAVQLYLQVNEPISSANKLVRQRSILSHSICSRSLHVQYSAVQIERKLVRLSSKGRLAEFLLLANTLIISHNFNHSFFCFCLSLFHPPQETPSLSRYETGIVNQGFDSLTRVPSPSFFYIDNSGGWLDGASQVGATNSTNGMPRRFTESWIELEQAYSCGSSSTANSKKCACCRKCCRWFVYLIIALCVIGFAAIISAILYMEVLHDMYEVKELAVNGTGQLRLGTNGSSVIGNFSLDSLVPTDAPFAKFAKTGLVMGTTNSTPIQTNVSSTSIANVTHLFSRMVTIVLESSTPSTPVTTNNSSSMSGRNAITASTTQSTNVSNSFL